MRIRRSSDSLNGQALVEFAMILPIAFLILAGIIQFGLIFSSAIGLQNAVREAARYGSVLATIDSSPASQVRGYLVGGNGTCGSSPAGILPTYVHPFQCAADPSKPGLPPTLTTVTYCYYQNVGSSPPTYSVRIMVSVAYNHPLFVPIITQLIDAIDGNSTPGSFRTTANEQMRVENQQITTPPPSLPQCQP